MHISVERLWREGWPTPCHITKSIERQDELVKAVAQYDGPSPTHHILIAQHFPVYTFDPRKGSAYDSFRKTHSGPKGIEVFPVNRPGGITFHGPGQFVWYLIFNLKNLKESHQFVFKMGSIIDSALIHALRKYNISAHRKPSGLPSAAGGVWITKVGPLRQKKLASRGIALRHRNTITTFGFALNITTDLRRFETIFPCGLDIEMTSMHEILQKPIEVEGVVRCVTEQLLSELTSRGLT